MGDLENKCENCSFLCEHKIDLSEEEFTILENNKVKVEFEAGETLLKQGTFADNIIILQSGLLKKVVQGRNQKNIIIKLNKPGDYIGLQMLGIDEGYPYSVVALKKSMVCIVRKDIIKEVFDRNKQFQNCILRYFSEDYFFNYNKLMLIGTKQMPGRLAEILLYLSDEVFQKEQVFAYLSRKDIAELAGMSVESMTKIFNEFKNDLLISVNGKEVVIKDEVLLRKLIEYS